MKGPFPDSFTSKMNPEDRPKGWMSSADAQEKYVAGEEKKLQSLIANYLSLHDIYFECERMDKRTRGKVGRPDFRICYRGRFLAVECKVKGAGLSKQQWREIHRIHKSGGMACIANSLADLQMLLRAVDVAINLSENEEKK